jgi:hypothetical protein
MVVIVEAPAKNYINSDEKAIGKGQWAGDRRQVTGEQELQR